MTKAKVGSTIRFINHDLTVDRMLSGEPNKHNQAALEFFLAIQEAVDARMDACEYSVHASLHFTID